MALIVEDNLRVEWVDWEAPQGRLHLADGRIVDVQYGDEILIRNDASGDCIAVLDHRPRTVH